MNIQHLRHSLKVKWLIYYRQNRPWLVRLRIWGTYDEQRRPSSSFILAALSNLEPQLLELFPFIIDLSNDPDQVVAALGLNFNPEQELKTMTEAPAMVTTNNGNGFSKQALHKVVDEQAGGGGLFLSVGTALGSLPRNEVEQELHFPTEEFNSFLSGGVQSTSVNPPLETPLPVLEDNLSPPPHKTIEEDDLTLSTQASNLPSWVDELCYGKASPNNKLVISVLLVISGVALIAFVGFA